MGGSVIGILLTGNHASRPTSGLAYGTLYSCTTHSLIYQTTDAGTTWVTWADLTAGGTPVLRLDYALASDVSALATTAATFADVNANQNFTVGSASSLIEVCVKGFGFFNDANNDSFLTRINVDSGGTPVIKYLTGGQNINTTANDRPNVLVGAPIWISGLSAATHTIKVQVTCAAGNNHFYCRAAAGVPTGFEFLHIQIIEHL